MKKKGLISFVIAMLICGCSCSKVNETTYNNAVSDFNSTDAISFTRIEKTVDNNDTSIYTKVTINVEGKIEHIMVEKGIKVRFLKCDYTNDHDCKETSVLQSGHDRW